MKSRIIPGVTVPEGDDRVALAIALPPRGGDQKPAMVALRNEQGDIYREVVVYGEQEFESLLDALYDVGYVDELEQRSGPHEGYDAIMTTATPASAARGRSG